MNEIFTSRVVKYKIENSSEGGLNFKAFYDGCENSEPCFTAKNIHNDIETVRRFARLASEKCVLPEDMQMFYEDCFPLESL